MEPLVLGLVAIAAAVGFGVMASLAGRGHTKIDLSSGTARLVRGALPPGLLGDLKDVARTDPSTTGSVSLTGQLDSLKISTRGLDEHVGQRVRNVILLRRRQIRRP